MEDLFGISMEWIILIGVNFFFIIILFFLNLATRSKLKKLRTKYNKFMSGLSGQNIEQLLENCIDKVDNVISRNRDVENHINEIERNLSNCIQKIGIIRFNAFDNVGSDLSFSIALLDDKDNGVVISGLYSRESSSTYAKPILKGKSKYPLSAEEMKAIDTARKTYRERPYVES